MPATVSDIAARLGSAARRFDVDVLDSCDSTNAVLMAQAEAGTPSGRVIVARRQTAGRGRRGREWFSRPGDSLTFSLFWRFAPGTSPAGLSLAVGLAVSRALEKIGAGGTALKWPNDILRSGRKLGGILIELLPGAPHAAVIGIGLNLRLPPDMPAELRATAAALEAHDSNESALYAAVMLELLAVLDAFAVKGFAAMRDDWLSRDAYQNAPVILAADFGPAREGICRGVDIDGALLFETEGRIERILSGEVSLRAA